VRWGTRTAHEGAILEGEIEIDVRGVDESKSRRVEESVKGSMFKVHSQRGAGNTRRERETRAEGNDRKSGDDRKSGSCSGSCSE
jgi:hypothetical protein